MSRGKLSLKDYTVEHTRSYHNDCTSIEYAFLWVKNPNTIENPPVIPEEDIKTIKKILMRHSVFEFKINLNL